MNEGQTIFRYIIVTSKSEFIPAVELFAYNGFEVGCGVITFLSEVDFETISESLKTIGPGYALILAGGLNYSDEGAFARVFNHIN